VKALKSHNGVLGLCPWWGSGGEAPEAEHFLPYQVIIFTLNVNTKN